MNENAYHLDGNRPFYYHVDCVNRNPLEDVAFGVIPLTAVPAGTECDFCYEPVHGPSGYQIRQGTIELTMMLYGVPNASSESFTEQQAMQLFNTLSDSAEHQIQLSGMPGYRITGVRIEGDRESGRVYATFEKQEAEQPKCGCTHKGAYGCYAASHNMTLDELFDLEGATTPFCECECHPAEVDEDQANYAAMRDSEMRRMNKRD